MKPRLGYRFNSKQWWHSDIWIERNGHRHYAFRPRCKLPLSDGLIRRICQRRVSAQHLDIFYRSVCVHRDF